MITRRVILLGSTGSIGVNTLAVIEHLNAQGQFHFEVVGLATGANAELMCKQAKRFGVRHVAVADQNRAECLREIPNVHAGGAAALDLIEAVARPGDLVVGAMVGSAGVPATLAAIERGCDIALANKETLVAAGALVMPLARQHNVQLLPIDSEHSAIFQCLAANQSPRTPVRGTDLPIVPAARRSQGQESLGFDPRGPDVSTVRRVVITASGGPFRTWTKERMRGATVDAALKHPTWSMGPKVTIDSATMMNKALEIIEAHWLFGLPAEKIDVLIHPQSLVHSFVEFVDGSVVAQLGPPDMRTPIQYALTWPHRAPGISRPMNWQALKSMEFESVDHDRFPAPRLAAQVIDSGGTAGAILNAANEAAVAAFVQGDITFDCITALAAEALEAIQPTAVRSLSDMMNADVAARAFVRERVAGISSAPARDLAAFSAEA